MYTQAYILHVTIMQTLSSALYSADTELTGDVGWGHPVQPYED